MNLKVSLSILDIWKEKAVFEVLFLGTGPCYSALASFNLPASDA